ncbi:MAG: hypothetical protein PHC63_06255 [Candidatus Bathyarchaeota archaeon]|jgi:hypothetical protein|nr:hypothetical protein [Candidatus Bathyarchaeota archaeon]MDI9578924.1 hypothetical protein [Thermoproteota archaeon]NLD65491.1 hypothetical protein [Thermoproteota archaeon]
MNKAKCILTIVICLLLLLAIEPFSILRAEASTQDAPALVWSKTYGPYLGYSVIQTTDGYFAVAGQNATYRPFEPHMPPEWENYTALLIKIDKEGSLLWDKTYENIGDGGFLDRANSIVETTDLGYALSGGNWLLKVNSEGNVEWKKTYPELENCRAIQTSDGDYAIIGNTIIDDNAYSVDSILLKIDSNGNTLWTKTFSSNLPQRNDVYAEYIGQTSSGDYVITGSWHATFWFAKLGSNGNLIFNQTYDEIANVGAHFTSVSQTIDGGFVLSGYNIDSKEVPWSGWIVKTDSQGAVQWIFHREEPANELLRGIEFMSVIQTIDGGYIAVGRPSIVKLNDSGALEWNMTGYNAFSVALAGNDGFIVAGGQGDTTGPNQELWVAKFDLKSTFPSDETISLPWVILIVIAIVIAVGVIGLLVYLRKHKQ